MKRVRLALFGLPPCMVLACAGVKSTPTGATGTGGSATVTGTGGAISPGTGGGFGGGTDGSASASEVCPGGCSDFAGGPFGPDGTTASVPAGAGQAFSSMPVESGGPCLLEPQDGTMLPNNWLRPRFTWTPTGASDLYELHLTAPNQNADLIVYTSKTSWTMPKPMWVALAGHTQDMSIQVTVLSAHSGVVSTGTTVGFTVAPVGASGSLVYWSPQGSTNGGTGPPGLTTLNGFEVGDETVDQVLSCGAVNKVLQCDITAADWATLDPSGTTQQPVTCIGCHTSTPDGEYISFNNFDPWGGVLASGQPGMMKGTPPMSFLGAGGYKAFTQPWLGITTYSPNHWAPTDHVVVAPLGGKGPSTSDTDQQSGLAWIDLENPSFPPSGQSPFTALRGTAWDWIFPPTAGKYAAAPSWSHLRAPADDFIVFTATSNVKSGRLGTGTAHLYKVPYARTGPQTATPIPGLDDATNPRYAQYYGSLSFDDRYIVYDQVDAKVAAATHTDLNTSDASGSTWDGMYMQPAAELYVTPTSGGPGIRLAANDPPSCPNQPVKGTINNTWAKWSPEVASANGNTYYWLIFSSWRQGDKDANGSPIAQLFMTVIVKPEAGPIQTYPAVYLWNQPAKVSNFTPAWDVFKIGNVG